MPIKNYTTKIDVYTSLGEIQGALASHGAKKVMVDYDDAGVPSGVAFAINTPAGLRGFMLPVNAGGVAKVLESQRVRLDDEQARRIAWRNVRDWILAQMALVEAGNVSVDEVFFPYLTNGRGETLYRLYASGQLALTDGKDKDNV